MSRDAGGGNASAGGGGLRDLQHTFEIGPFPGSLPDLEVARFMSQWRVSGFEGEGWERERELMCVFAQSIS